LLEFNHSFSLGLFGRKIWIFEGLLTWFAKRAGRERGKLRKKWHGIERGDKEEIYLHYF
jgi:hypothetical protein